MDQQSEETSVRKRSLPGDFIDASSINNVNLELSLGSDYASSSSSSVPPPLPSPQQQQQPSLPPSLALLALDPNQLHPYNTGVSSSQSPTTSTSTRSARNRGYVPQRTVAARRTRRSSTQSSSIDVISPPYAWATNRRAIVHSLEYLRSKNITKITGEIECKKCNTRRIVEYDVEEKFREIAEYIFTNSSRMDERAPNRWMKPVLPNCNKCGTPGMKPVIPAIDDEINWLFLFLGQKLGLCTLSQLKYFCQHTKNHRTGAKDRLIYLAYLGLCKQLDPMGPFDRLV
ncbi:hydroxyproline-rich glycoprotein family protein [Thalictrum thalictroides]|uniref:Hydroxyproline-rich glycoprotein family protein n=1 Tax=Thalictrum thalictroides TaxID=46969 RepID=A0A7J6XDC9_THATH|nr:hydroxyproline-rich glycoprotein family protein [Thalictrum thalictroides]